MSKFVFATDLQKKFFESEEELVMFGGYGSYGKPSALAGLTSAFRGREINAIVVDEAVDLSAIRLSLQHGEPRPCKTLPCTD